MQLSTSNMYASIIFVTCRNGKSCRLRWCNQLAPGVNKEPFTEEEVGACA